MERYQTPHSSTPLLEARDLESGYARKRVLQGLSFHIQPGEVVALLGPNGAGKSTALKTIFGILKVWSGSVIFNNKPIQNRPPLCNIREGVAYVPQGGKVFTDLQVKENLEVGGFILPKRQVKGSIEHVIELFPILGDRYLEVAGKLSGGERQMLSLGMALMTQPRLLLLDEPSLGLAPQTTKETLKVIMRLNKELAAAILLVEQNVREALNYANRVYVMRLGRVVMESRPEELNYEVLRSAFLE